MYNVEQAIRINPRSIKAPEAELILISS